MIPEDNPFLDSDTASGVTRSRMDLLGSRHHRYSRYGFPEGLAEVCLHIMVFFALYSSIINCPCYAGLFTDIAMPACYYFFACLNE